MIYTTYFAKLNKLPSNIVPISICGKAPNGYNGLQYKKLAPKYDFFMKWKQDHDNNHYIKCFNEQVLMPLSPQVVLQELKNMANSEDIALVCYEKPSDFCHRHLVSSWFRNNGIKCIEYDIKEYWEEKDRIASEYFDDKESEHEMDEVFDLAKKALEERKLEAKLSDKRLICNSCRKKYGCRHYEFAKEFIKENPNNDMKCEIYEAVVAESEE